MTTERVRFDERTIPAVPGVLSPADVLATAHAIAEIQQPDGMIPWFVGGHCDPSSPRSNSRTG
jgi:hypothetical protein